MIVILLGRPPARIYSSLENSLYLVTDRPYYDPFLVRLAEIHLRKCPCSEACTLWFRNHLVLRGLIMFLNPFL